MNQSSLLSLDTVSTLPWTSTVGASGVAGYVQMESLRQGGRLVRESFSVGLPPAFEALCAVRDEYSFPNWDGDNAEPIELDTYKYAYRFLEALPLGSPSPAISPEPDGHIALEWHRSRRHTLSVSVSPTGELHYAALLGARETYGTEPFFGEMPKAIIDLIQNVAVK
jgi:hypothetical protein